MQVVDFSTKQNAKIENKHELYLPHILIHILKIRIGYSTRIYMQYMQDGHWPVLYLTKPT